MPIYEYECRNCSGRFEKIVYKESASTKCVACGSSRVEKCISGFAVVGSNSIKSPDPTGCSTCGAERPGMCRQME